MKRHSNGVLYSPSDLITFVKSPFASWMDRYYLENPELVAPDEDTEEQKLVAGTGDQHELAVLGELKAGDAKLVEISKADLDAALTQSRAAIQQKPEIIYQAALRNERFAGYSDFLILNGSGDYEIWDTKLARSPKPYYAVQLCCYAEMFAAMTGGPLPKSFGIILGSGKKVTFRTEDFIHYYRRVRDRFLSMQDGFTGKMDERPEPVPNADHGRWSSHADEFFLASDHIVQVAGITVGQIKKLKNAGIHTVKDLAAAASASIPKLAAGTVETLVSQARLQCQTREDRAQNADAPARFELLPHTGENGEPVGLGALPPADAADVFFDMEGYPLVAGGLEYLFGVSFYEAGSTALQFKDWWGHDRDGEKRAFEGFVDWVYARWQSAPYLHIYHYSAYEPSALRTLSTRHDTRQIEVDALLRENLFVDLYQVVRHGLRIGVDSYSIKAIEHLYREKRTTAVATAMESVVQYARWLTSGQPGEWNDSKILADIRAYNRDDCDSTAGLLEWLRGVASRNGIAPRAVGEVTVKSEDDDKRSTFPLVIAQRELLAQLQPRTDAHSIALSHLIDFHWRDLKPVFWRKFDRAVSTAEKLRDDAGCIQGVRAIGEPVPDKQSLVQTYQFDPAQECKLSAGPRARVSFTFLPKVTMALESLDLARGQLALKISRKGLAEKFGGQFPQVGSLIVDEFVDPETMQLALVAIGTDHLSSGLSPNIIALLNRQPPAAVLQGLGESTLDAAIRVASGMSGGCLVIQGPPGTGKTYTAAHMINALLDQGMRIGISSNSHKAVVNLMEECGKVRRDKGRSLKGIKVGGDAQGSLYDDNPDVRYVPQTKGALAAYDGGVVGGTAWLFSMEEWIGALDFLFLDEAGQVSLANGVAMAPSAKNIVLLGDQMQLEQPIQGTHPGDAGLSSLQYALKELEASEPDAPVFHAVVPADYGLFLAESLRMHPDVCRFISESIYEGRLTSFPACSQQKIALPATGGTLVKKESGIVLATVEHDGNIQHSEEEVSRVKELFEELLGRPYTDRHGDTTPLELKDFLFIAPYNAQVRALQAALPNGARVGSVDKFQGQQAPVCILSLCSSCGEYGSRGLAFILDRNRINVAISRAQCLAIVVADARIASTTAGSIEEMRLLNIFCKLVDACG